MSQLFQIINKHLPSSHGYADDKQLYLPFSPDSPVAEDQTIQIICNCIDEFRAWLVSRKPMFNDTKTEFLTIGTRQQLAKVTIDSIGVGDAEKNLAQNVRNLSSWFHKHMSMKVHVSKVCSKAFRGFYNIRQTRKFLSIESTKTLVHAFVISHLDYCNTLLFGIPQYQIKRLQRVLNAAARITCFIPRCTHITPALMLLHWLPVKFCVQFKITLLDYKALNGMTPDYTANLPLEKPLRDRAFAHAGHQHGTNYHITLEIINQLKILNLN